mgnify:CR=1 FL=1
MQYKLDSCSVDESIPMGWGIGGAITKNIRGLRSNIESQDGIISRIADGLSHIKAN